MGTTAKLFGKYCGICVENVDPEQLSRIKVKIPSLFGQEVLEEWALPCLPPGFNGIPDAGSPVWVEFIAGDENHPIWSGVWFSKQHKPGPEFKQLLTDAAADVFNGHTHPSNGSAPTQKLDKTQHTTKVRGR